MSESCLIEYYLALIKNYDVGTYQHCLRVSKHAKFIGNKIGLSSPEITDVGNAALLHDLGKIRIPKYLLNKPGSLLNHEYEIMEQHPFLGIQVIKNNHQQSLSTIISGIQSHHEMWAGFGYPDGLHGEDIPLNARIIAITDAFDAMTSHRPYRSRMEFRSALNEIEDCKGSQFDPYIVKNLLFQDRKALYGALLEFRSRYLG